MKKAALAALLALAACATDDEEPACVIDESAPNLPCLPKGSTVYLGDKRVEVIE